MSFPLTPVDGQQYTTNLGTRYQYSIAESKWIIVSQSLGVTGAQGNTGTVGPAGSAGDTGLPGSQGQTGAGGTTGVKGDQGSTGIEGLTGPVGLTGAQGSKGDTGSQGNTGIVGPLGATGSEGHTGIVGPAGTTGVAGDQGQTGTIGPSGATGIVGPDGQTGAQGHTGLQGSKGDTGSQGGPGSEGPTGPQGQTGIVGPTGTSGSQGTTGVGYTGAQGQTGLVGPTGPSGAGGATGISGITGSQGPIGDTGIQGVTGVFGTSGGTGVQGQTGVKGDQGNTGAVGPAGSNGSQGATGVPGPTGLTGYTGVQGQTGAQGYTGPVGPTGAQGFTGAIGIGGYGSPYYYHNDPSGVSGSFGPMESLFRVPGAGAETTDSVTVSTTQGSTGSLFGGHGYITASGDPSLTSIPPGEWTFNIWASTSSVAAGRVSTVRVDMLKYATDGTTTLLFSTINSGALTTATLEYSISYTQQAAITLANTDRLISRVWGVQNATGGTATITYYYEGTSHTSDFISTIGVGQVGATGLQGATGLANFLEAATLPAPSIIPVVGWSWNDEALYAQFTGSASGKWVQISAASIQGPTGPAGLTAGATGSNVVPAGTLAVVIGGVTHYLLTAASA
jgi:collagen type VII alpha